MSLWSDISATRLTAGRLWMPQLSLDLMGRDWCSFTVPCDFEFQDTASESIGGTGEFDSLDAFAITVCYPDQWDVDDSYSVQLKVDIYLSLYYTHSGGSSPQVYVGFENASGSAWVTDTSSPGTYYNIRKIYTSGLPTGPTDEMIQWSVQNATNGETFNLYADRTMGDRGSDSVYKFEIP